MKTVATIVRHIPGFRRMSSQSKLIAATYYGLGLFVLAQRWYWGLALLAAPFLVFYLLDVNQFKRRRLSLAVSAVAGLAVLVGVAGGLASGAANGSEALAVPTAHVIAAKSPAPTPTPASPTAQRVDATPALSAVLSATAEPGKQYAYVAAHGGKVFHKPGCASARRIKPENLIGFSSREEAVAAGLTPCQRCKP